MARLSDTSFGKDWLLNFDEPDRLAAAMLIDRLMLVSASEFTIAITSMLTKLISTDRQNEIPLALYAEREVDLEDYVAKPFFPDTDSGRAVGGGIQPVLVNTNKQDVGSEGILAALISKFCSLDKNAALSHPGPDLLRNRKVRKIVIITDFIGSGRRIGQMLDAFAKVATLQSWKSYHLMSFEVVCYSATEWGAQSVRRHSLSPSVSMHIACPVIDEAFRGKALGQIRMLCKKYPKKTKFPFGFSDTGSLIAFSHGIPNNAPAILHSNSSGWRPLFQGRSTLAASLDIIADSSQLIAENSNEVLGIRNARALLKDVHSELWAHTMLVLNTIKIGLRTASQVSARTQLTLVRIEEVFSIAITAGWLTTRNSLTRLGRRELRCMKSWHGKEFSLAQVQSPIYFPTQLRAQ